MLTPWLVFIPLPLRTKYMFRKYYEGWEGFDWTMPRLSPISKILCDWPHSSSRTFSRFKSALATCSKLCNNLVPKWQLPLSVATQTWLHLLQLWISLSAATPPCPIRCQQSLDQNQSLQHPLFRMKLQQMLLRHLTRCMPLDCVLAWLNPSIHVNSHFNDYQVDSYPTDNDSAFGGSSV